MKPLGFGKISDGEAEFDVVRMSVAKFKGNDKPKMTSSKFFFPMLGRTHGGTYCTFCTETSVHSSSLHRDE